MALATIQEAIEDIRDGKFVIVVDDEGRENEGDLVIAAEKISPEAINFMAKHARGLICVPLTAKRLDELNIPMMVRHNTSHFDSPFTVSVESRHRVTTGISASDRATTVQVLIDPSTKPEDIVYPGHMFPLRARAGGVLVRAGHTEASIDLAKLAGLYPGAVICEVMNDDGTMARLPDLEILSAKHHIKIVSVTQLIAYRRRHDKLVRRIAEAHLPTKYGEFMAIAYKSVIDTDEHVALVKGDIITCDEPILVRVHSECLTGDVFGSLRCDCGAQVPMAMEAIEKEGKGVFLYMRQEGRGIGLHNKIKAYALQDTGLDTVEANEKLGFAPDLRDYGIGAQILVDLGIRNMKLLTNNPKKVIGLEGYGLRVTETLPILAPATPENIGYLKTKREKLGHLIDIT
ncbi:MAG: bifunctional 3,4-dihydroxy-2-butanone-4-phosphate synthase/GTP cyclohydrolase II [Dehalococcoidia bacterium]|nr:bifunctional 3,4-dihydroxy-2-butanone-4-phosphate synthase/GTP cyclohydrolase II [Dehalococcoidia bacterium]